MRSLISGLIGVPAVILLAAGLGIMVVTVVGWVQRQGSGQIRWAHFFLGVGFCGSGVVLLILDMQVFGVG